MRILACVMIIMVWLSPAAMAASSRSESQDKGKNKAEDGLSDPFYPGLPAKTLKVRYRLSGRFEGQEMLAAKKSEKGVLKVREIRGTDTALGLERTIHWWILETPDFVLQLDLVNGRKEIHPNIRKMLSDSWQALTEEQKTNLNENLPAVGGIVGHDLRVGVAVADYEATFLGLATVKVALGAGRVWYWAKTDVVLKALGHQGGFTWTKEAIDVIQNQELNDALFQLPQGDGETQRLEVPAEELNWTRSIVKRVVALLSRALLGMESSNGSRSEKKSAYHLPVPWPFPEPPGFRDEDARYRLDPNWAPYPKPPDQRPWPPPGLGTSILKVELQDIDELLSERMPSRKPPVKPAAPGGSAPAGASNRDGGSGEPDGPDLVSQGAPIP